MFLTVISWYLGIGGSLALILTILQFRQNDLKHKYDILPFLIVTSIIVTMCVLLWPVFVCLILVSLLPSKEKSSQ